MSPAVLGFVLLSVSPLFLLATRSNAAGADLGVCGALAMERMETLRLQGFTSLAVGGDLAVNTADYHDTSNDGFVVRWKITDATTPAGGKIIAVRALAERETVGKQKMITFTTLRVP